MPKNKNIMKKNYFHITPIEDKDDVLKNGLLSNEGDIEVFDDISIANQIASNQMGLYEYCLFRVDPRGFDAPPIPDEIAEFTARHQWIVQQKKIEPKFLRLVSTRIENPFEVAEENVRKFAIHYGLKEEELLLKALSIRPKWFEYYIGKYGPTI
jgi:hypothetical protein